MFVYNHPSKSLWLKNASPSVNRNVVYQFLQVKSDRIKILILDLSNEEFLVKVKFTRKMKAYTAWARLQLPFIHYEVIANPQTLHKSFSGVANLFALTLEKRLTLATTSERDFQELTAKLKFFCVKANFQENYVVEKSIGSGSFAKVYRARSRDNSQLVAVKAFSKEYLKKI